jgi:hypothetical protein
LPWPDCCGAREERALERFHDGERLYALRDAMRSFTASAPHVDALVSDHVARWLEHDAERLACRGLPAPDLGRLRAELQMPVDAWQ